MTDKTAAQQIDDIIKMHEGWKAGILSEVRGVIKEADPDVTEEIKWKMKTRPEGLAVWSHDGIICFAEVWKDNIKLLFPKGAKLKDPSGLFNARLMSKDIRAIEFREDSAVDHQGLILLIQEATNLK